MRQRIRETSYILGAIIALMAGVVTPTLGQGPPMMSVQVSPPSAITGLGATTQDGLGINLSTRFISRSERQAGTMRVANPDNEKTQTWQTTLLLDYRVARRLTAILAIPGVDHDVSYANLKQTVRDFGDIAMYGKVSLYQNRDAGAEREISALAGVEVPSGSTDQSDASGRFPASQQPGSSSTDFIIGGAAVWGFPALTAFGNLSYKINGDSGYTFGDFLALNTGINYTLPQLKQLGLVAEFNFERAARDKSNVSGPGVLPGGIVRDTGSEKIFLSPGFQWRPGGRWSLNFNAQVPAYQDLHGTQLASKINYIFGVSTRFSRR